MYICYGEETVFGALGRSCSTSRFAARLDSAQFCSCENNLCLVTCACGE